MLRLSSRRRRSRCLVAVSAAAMLACGPASPSRRCRTCSRACSARPTGSRSAEAVTLDNVSIDLGFAVYRMPKIEFSGVNLPRAELQRLFDKSVAEPVGPRLAKLSAKQVQVPELIVEQQVGGERQITRYRDIVVDDIANGRIASAVKHQRRLRAEGCRRPGRPRARWDGSRCPTSTCRRRPGPIPSAPAAPPS